MEAIIKHVLDEVEKVQKEHSPYHSIHEGYAIMLEEFDKLWDEIKDKDPNYTRIYNEAKQVACTSLRFMKLVEQIKKEKGIL